MNFAIRYVNHNSFLHLYKTKMMNHPFIKTSLLTLLFISSQTLSAQINENAMKYAEVLNYVNSMYVDKVNDTKLTEHAIRSMLEDLDPHSAYISREDVDDANEKINGSFVGVGIRFQIVKDTLQVVQTIPGGPSEKVGLLAGDRILRIDQESVAGVGLKNTQVRGKLLGEKGTKVQVVVKRRGTSSPISFTITRDKIPVYSVDTYYMIRPTIGYIKLNSFSRSSLDEIQAGLTDLRKKGMQHLILDLQDNGGGLLFQAQKIADEFLSGDKLIVYSEGDKQDRSELSAGRKGLWEDGKLVVLTNESTASASEILSGAIQDWDRGLIVGRRTYGKGLVQRPIDLSDGSQLRLTIARYYTPSGRFIQKAYENSKEDYLNELSKRYERGEYMDAEKIEFPDSLKHNTLITKRTVYGGGGIMPDVFVPLDTTGFNEMYRTLARGGYINSFGLQYLDKNRKALELKFPDFETFKSGFVCDKTFMKEFFDYVDKENSEFKYTDKEYKVCKYLLDLRLKAVLAQDLWGISEFYQIYNDANEILQKAIDVLEKNTYDKMNLAIK